LICIGPSPFLYELSTRVNSTKPHDLDPRGFPRPESLPGAGDLGSPKSGRDETAQAVDKPNI
jgi:hypothetical protein